VITSPTIRRGLSPQTRVIATDKETGKVAWETNIGDGQPELALTAAPLPVKDKIVIGAAGGR
jgi:alcohol dehydrogenase (cytochrome c)